jgi:hypothetical protein
VYKIIKWDPKQVKEYLRLAHLHFGDSLSCGKIILWPGSKGAARKKHRPVEFRNADS